MVNEAGNNNAVIWGTAYQHFSAFCASSAAFSVGVSVGWSSFAQSTITSSLDYGNDEDTNWVCGTLFLGAMIGALFSLPLVWMTEWVPPGSGISRALWIAAMPTMLVGWLFLMMAEKNKAMVITGRVNCGLSMGMITVLVPLYIAEIATKRMRDLMMVYFQVMLCAGITHSLVVAYLYYDPKAEPEKTLLSRYSLYCALPCVISLLSVNCPPSALEKMMLDPDDQAAVEISMRKLGTVDPSEVSQELARMRAFVNNPKPRIAYLNKNFLVAFVDWLLVIFGANTDGSIFLILRLSLVLGFISEGKESTEYIAMLFGILLFVSSIVGIGTVGVLGRKRMMVIGGVLTAVSISIIGYQGKGLDKTGFLSETAVRICYAFFALYFTAWNSSFGPVYRAILADSFPIPWRLIMSVLAYFFIYLFIWIELSVVSTTLAFDNLCYYFGGSSLGIAILSVFFVRDYSSSSIMDLQELLWDKEG